MNTIITKTIGITLIVLLAFSANAQKFNYGIKAGSNFAVQSKAGDLYNNNDVYVGLHFGAFGNYSLSESFKLQTEVNYNQKGSAYDNITNNYEYVSVPVLAKLSLGKSLRTPLHFNIYAGPYASFLINAESEVSDIENNQTIDKKDDTNNTEVGLVGGFGILYPLNNSNIFLDFRLGMGLTEFDKNDNDLRNKHFGISLGLEF
jgi:hypothetical protein